MAFFATKFLFAVYHFVIVYCFSDLPADFLAIVNSTPPISPISEIEQVVVDDTVAQADVISLINSEIYEEQAVARANALFKLDMVFFSTTITFTILTILGV